MKVCRKDNTHTFEGIRCLECDKTNKKAYYEANKEQQKANVKAWSRTNPAKCNAYAAKRRSKKLNATPKWLTEQQLQEIELFYTKSKELEIKTGIKYHVDHVVPLQGKTVSGLHVPWNLRVITAEENFSKGNSFDGTYENNSWNM